MPEPWWTQEGRREAGSSVQGQNTQMCRDEGGAWEAFWSRLTLGLGVLLSILAYPPLLSSE